MAFVAYNSVRAKEIQKGMPMVIRKQGRLRYR